MMFRLRHGVVAVACSVVVGLGAATAGAASKPTDQLRSFVCQKALDPVTRGVSVQAVMRPVTGTAKMQMRFQLMHQTSPGRPFTLVRGRLLGSWISPSDPTLGQRPDDIWMVTHPVVDLAAPATYRFRVAFRWTGANGQPLASAVQTSPTCYEPELRPDLLVRSLTVASQGPGSDDVYTFVVANRGQTGAGPFQVALTGAGAVSQTATISSLGPRSSTRQRFVAPACTPGSNVTATVDPLHTTEEYSYANNAVTIACPASGSTS